MVDAGELELLRASQASGEPVSVIVHGCAYSCCGRGWMRRDSYLQTYRGRIDNLTDGTFMLYSQGLGTIGYVLVVRFDEVEIVSS